MTAAITLLLSVIASIAGTAGAPTIATIITALTNILPFLIQEVTAVVPLVKNIIAALKGNDQITQDQLDQLTALEATYDADFEAAAAAYGDPNAPPAA